MKNQVLYFIFICSLFSKLFSNSVRMPVILGAVKKLSRYGTWPVTAATIRLRRVLNYNETDSVEDSEEIEKVREMGIRERIKTAILPFFRTARSSTPVKLTLEELDYYLREQEYELERAKFRAMLWEGSGQRATCAYVDCMRILSDIFQIKQQIFNLKEKERIQAYRNSKLGGWKRLHPHLSSKFININGKKFK
ncbi:hypothetical protein KAW80_01960 [Candidatus Babeliales bacterium]|nr:hypothetical protein [Candidatus Babeliales bacterium]